MRRDGKPTLLQTIVVFLFILLASTVVYGKSLQEEFDTLCVHTQDAENLSLEKLRVLVSDCDLLQKKMEESKDTKKKVLLFRLKKCRDFLTYVMEIKQSDN